MRLAKLIAMLRDRKNREKIYCTSEYWNNKAQRNEGDAISMWPNPHLNTLYHKEQTYWLEHYLDDVHGKDVLDIGCGSGRISRYFASRGGRVTGVDFAECAIDIARKLSSETKIAYSVLSIFELNYKCSFDIAVTWGTLALCKNKQELLSALNRIRQAMRPGGQVIFCEPLHNGFLHRVLRMDVNDFCKVMQEANFQVADKRDLYFWPIRLFLGYCKMPIWITLPFYYLGLFSQALLGGRIFGDYKLVFAKAV